MLIPFAIEAYQRNRANTPEQTLVNLIVERDDSNSEEADERVMLLQRPGLEKIATLPGPVQAIYCPSNAALDATFAIAANQLCSIDDNNTVSVLGAVSGTTGIATLTANFDRLAMVSYPLFYLYGATADSTVNSFRNVPIPDLFGTGAPKAIAVTMLNGYFIVACEDGTFLWLEPGQDAFNPLNFATAESSPDGLVGVTTLNGNLVFLGTRTVENWQPTGNADLPFQRTTGQDYARGCLAGPTIVNIDNAVIWVGEDGKVYRSAQTPLRISTDGIDERLKLRTGDPSAWTFAHDGHLFYVLTIPGQGTFTYDVATQLWSEFQSQGLGYWLPRVGCMADSGWVCGGGATGDVWRVSDAATDAGTAFDRTASATAAVKNQPERVDNIILDIGTSGPCSWQIRWADADEALADQTWIALPSLRAGADCVTFYRLGAARSPYRTFELRVSDPVVVRISGVRVGEAWR